jgi:hypothetical protein
MFKIFFCVFLHARIFFLCVFARMYIFLCVFARSYIFSLCFCTLVYFYHVYLRVSVFLLRVCTSDEYDITLGVILYL